MNAAPPAYEAPYGNGAFAVQKDAASYEVNQAGKGSAVELRPLIPSHAPAVYAAPVPIQPAAAAASLIAQAAQSAYATPVYAQPAAAAALPQSVQCGSCQGMIGVAPNTNPGMQLTCPLCGQMFRMPGAAPPAMSIAVAVPVAAVSVVHNKSKSKRDKQEREEEETKALFFFVGGFFVCCAWIMGWMMFKDSKHQKARQFARLSAFAAVATTCCIALVCVPGIISMVVGT